MFFDFQALTRKVSTFRKTVDARAPKRTRPTVEFLENRWAPAVTTTTLTADYNATTGGQLITFTAAVAPSPDAGSVTFRDNVTTIPGGANVALTGGVAIFSTSVLSIGTHEVIAAFNGAAGFDASVSNPQTVVVGSDAQTALVNIVPNGGIPNLKDGPHSRLVNLQYQFNQPVNLEPDAITKSLHPATYIIEGESKPFGWGSDYASQKLILTGSDDKKTWTVTFSASTYNGHFEVGKDGFISQLDGVYDFKIDASKVHSVSSPTTSFKPFPTFTFHTLWGDATEPTRPEGGTPGVDFTATVNSADNLAFRKAFFARKGDPNYKAYFDFDGSGIISTVDNLIFRNRYTQRLTWSI